MATQVIPEPLDRVLERSRVHLSRSSGVVCQIGQVADEMCSAENPLMKQSLMLAVVR